MTARAKLTQDDPEYWKPFWARVLANSGHGVININSLDPECPHGQEEVIDLDREEAIRDGEHIESVEGRS